MFNQKPQWWWQTDEYTVDTAMPEEFKELSGPQGVGLVRAWPTGATMKGWGEDEFAGNYRATLFHPNNVKMHYEKKGLPFAYLMRSMQIVCIDIDGKNGGIEHAQELLGNAPATLAETSKSGNGYHLFYSVPEEWDEKKGFAKFSDAIGIVTGVDIRSTGCVYHYPHQRWNGRPIVELPKWIYDRLNKKESFKRERVRLIEQVETLTDLEKLMLHEDLLEELKKPIDDGKRNNTLFAIGSQMKTAQVPDWERLVEARAIEVGLDLFEADKLVVNIGRYGSAE